MYTNGHTNSVLRCWEFECGLRTANTVKTIFQYCRMTLGCVHVLALSDLSDPLFHFRLCNVQARLAVMLLSQNTFMADRFSHFTIIRYCIMAKKHIIDPHRVKTVVHQRAPRNLGLEIISKRF